MENTPPLNESINKTIKLTLFVSFLALFFTAIGIAAGYKNWLRIHDKAKLALQKIKTIENDQSLQKQLNKLIALQENIQIQAKLAQQSVLTSQANLQRLNDQSLLSANYLNKQIQAITQQYQANTRLNSNDTQWLRNNIHYLLQLILYKHQLGADNKQLIILFHQLSHLLAKLSDPNLLLLQKKIDQTIIDLSYKKNIQLSHLLINLNQMDRMISSLAYQAIKKDTLPKINNEPNNLKDKLKDYFNNKLLIRQYSSNINLLNQSEQQHFYRILLLRIQLLHLSLLQVQPKNTAYLIQSIQQALTSYLLPTTPKTSQAGTLSKKQIEQWLLLLTQLNTYNKQQTSIDIESLLTLFYQLNKQ